MAESPKLSFAEQAPAQTGVLVVLTDDGIRFGRAAARATPADGSSAYSAFRNDEERT